MRIRRLLPTLLLSTAAVFPAAAGQYDMCVTAADSVNCIIEQAEFARQRNAEIDASIANVSRTRAFEHARNAEIAASIAAVNATRTRQLEIEQNALANRVLAVANAERNRRFAAYQNELATELGGTRRCPSQVAAGDEHHALQVAAFAHPALRCRARAEVRQAPERPRYRLDRAREG